MELAEIKGLGPVRLQLLQQNGISTIEDLLMVMPKRYRNTAVITPVSSLQEGEFCCIRGCLKSEPVTSYFHGRSQTTAIFTDKYGKIPVIWFNQPWISSRLKNDMEYCFSGTPSLDKRGRLRIVNPRQETESGIIPEYSMLNGITSSLLSKWIGHALSVLDDCCPETLPPDLRFRYGLCERNYALRQIHRPTSVEALDSAKRRLFFEQLLFYQTALSILRSLPGTSEKIPTTEDDAAFYWNALPFSPTGAQQKVLLDIIHDMRKNTPMHRMIQGDVGSGKTAVAFGAAYCCTSAGFQCALMAPTEILAVQHYENAKKLLEPMGIRCGLLTGSLNAESRRSALHAIESGEWQVIIGTHALISENVQFSNLALAITDEQHRFGVQQRQKLSKKAGAGSIPHMLVMSATPIPRSLALMLYGDLDLSVLDELPPGRSPVKTFIVPERKRDDLYSFIIKQASLGFQTYFVCPLVEESEKIDVKSVQEEYGDLCNGPLASLKIGLTYGNQNTVEKEKVLSEFSKGMISVLVATTVIEVGINVPNATVMVIENAERFGLSQLHQLRGRVGRGAAESWCFLLAEPNDRLKALCSTNDGFEIARKDLELRGPGEILGTEQHGKTALAFLFSDSRLVAETQQCLKWLRNDPEQHDAFEAVCKSAEKLFEMRLKKTVLN